MTKLKRTLTLLLAFVMVLTLSPIQANAAKKVKLNKNKLSLYVGKTYTLKLKNNKSKVKWTSSKKTVATVSSKGKVKAKKKGSCKITAKVGKKKYVCNVNVKKKTTTTRPSTTSTPTENPPTAITDNTFSGKIFAGYAWVLLEEYMTKKGYSNYTVTTISSATCIDSKYKDCIQIEGIYKNTHYFFIAGLQSGQPTINKYSTSMTVKGVNSYYMTAIMFIGEENYNMNGEFSKTGIEYDYYELKANKDQYKAEGNYQIY